jgi:hypothetical protein
MSDEPTAETDGATHPDLDDLIKTALAVGDSYPEAAAVARTSARTVRRKMSDRAFADDVSARRAEYVSALTGRLMAAGPAALRVMLECLDSPNDAVRLRAAHMIVSTGVQLRATGELEARLAAVETREKRSR